MCQELEEDFNCKIFSKFRFYAFDQQTNGLVCIFILITAMLARDRHILASSYMSMCERIKFFDDQFK